MKNNSLNIKYIAKHIQAKIINNSNNDTEIYNIKNLVNADKNSIAYISDKKYIKQLKSTKAGVVIIANDLLKYYNGCALVVENAQVGFAKCSQLFNFNNKIGIHKTAIIADSADIASGVYIAPHCVIGNGVKIGKNTIIGANCCIDDNVIIGANNNFAGNNSIGTLTTIGDNNFIEYGVVIGSQGFGNALDKNKNWHSIYHFGGVKIHNNINIGANSVIDKAVFDDTEIKNGVRIDNLVHIAHNVIIDENTAIAAGAKIAGSTKIGKRCQIGGMVGIINYINISDDVVIYSNSIILQDIKKSGIYTGIMPTVEHKKWLKIRVILKKLDEVFKK